MCGPRSVSSSSVRAPTFRALHACALPHGDASHADATADVYKYCSPTRSGIQSGRHPFHVNPINAAPDIYNPGDPVSGFAAIPRNMTGIGTKMSAAGYKVSCIQLQNRQRDQLKVICDLRLRNQCIAVATADIYGWKMGCRNGFSGPYTKRTGLLPVDPLLSPYEPQYPGSSTGRCMCVSRARDNMVLVGEATDSDRQLVCAQMTTTTGIVTLGPVARVQKKSQFTTCGSIKMALRDRRQELPTAAHGPGRVARAWDLRASTTHMSLAKGV